MNSENEKLKQTVCTKDNPDPNADEHPDAVYVGDCDYCAYLECPNCGRVVI